MALPCRAVSGPNWPRRSGLRCPTGRFTRQRLARSVQMSDEVEVVRRLFATVEDRDLERMLACYSDDVEICEAEVLPYGGIWRGKEGATAHAVGFMRSWAALQGPGERVLGARFWGDGAGLVCVLFRHRAVDPVGGARFDAPEVGIYQVRDERVVRSQMFHADSAAVLGFLLNAGRGEPQAAVPS
jgi:ketosteroid isomerase-like protein